MSFIEFFGMVMGLVALAVLSARKAKEERRRRMHPEEFAHEKEEEERAYRELLNTLDLPLPKELAPDLKGTEQSSKGPRAAPQQSSAGWTAPVTKRLVRSDFKFNSRIDARHQQTRIENRRLKNAIEERQARFKRKVGSEAMQSEHSAGDAYFINTEPAPAPRSQQILAQLESPLQMVLFHEVLSKPKALMKMGPLHGLPWEG